MGLNYFRNSLAGFVSLKSPDVSLAKWFKGPFFKGFKDSGSTSALIMSITFELVVVVAVDFVSGTTK